MINLLPYKEKKTIEKIRNIRFAQLVVTGFLLICFSVILLLLPTFININYRSSLEMKQVNKLQENGMVSNDIDLPSLFQRSKQVELKLSAPQIIEPTQYIKTLEDLTPKGIFIDRYVSSKSKNLEISGISSNREVLQSFIEILKNNKQVSSVDSPVSNFIESKNSPFRINIVFK